MILTGFMTSVELERYQSVPSVEFNTYWIPCTWFINLLTEIKKGSRITDSHGLQIIMEVFYLYFEKVKQ
jgi:bestrophin-3